MVSHQKIIKDRKQEEDKQLNKEKELTDIKKAVCKPITYAEAKKLILEYEYLGTMSTGYIQAFGIFYNNILSGAIVFCLPPSKGVTESVLGKKYQENVCVLARGACTYWAHPHSASKLISFGTDWMSKNTKYFAFIAYADPEAGEIGTVYQACNWIYTGQTEAKTEYFINNKWKPGYAYRKLKKLHPTSLENIPVRKSSQKHRYVLIKNKRTKSHLSYVPLPYPKRENLIKQEGGFSITPSDTTQQNVIYKITNLTNQKVYIGQTIQNIPERYPGLQLTNSRCCGTAIHNAAKKYGNHNFHVEIIYQSPYQNKDQILQDLNEKEQFYIQQYQSHIFGYNIALGGNNREKSQEEKNRISETHSKLKSTLSFFCSPSGEKVKVVNLSKFCKENKLDYRAIHHVKSNKKYSYQGWRLWKEGMSAYTPEESKQQNILGSVKSYTLYFNGMPQQITNLKAFCSHENLNYSNMKALTQKRLKSYRGWTVFNPSELGE